MPKKRYKPEEIVAKLRQVDVHLSQGSSVADAIRKIGVSEVTYYRWRQEFGGLKISQVKRLKGGGSGRIMDSVTEGLITDAMVLEQIHDVICLY